MSTAGFAQGNEPAGSFVVQFERRSFDLAKFRSAIRSRVPQAELNAIVRTLEESVRRDQAGFGERLRSLGGQVIDQWWLVNGCSIKVRPAHIARLRQWPNIRSVQPDTIRRPHLVVAADNVHHGSAAANRMRNAGGDLITGKDVAVAVLDTGADADSGNKKRPHACYFPDGDPSQTNNGGIGGSLLLEALKLPVSPSGDDRDGHGTAVAGCVGANKWNSQFDVGNGVAPGTGIVSMNITDQSGWSQDSWIVTAWQTITARRLARNIGAGNNSFSGSPNLDNIVQQALDSAAFNADMLICVSAGNFGRYTAESQGAFNGLAVGSIDKIAKTRSNFSAIGPLYGTNRTYPDLTAVGNQVVLPQIDDEASKVTQGGTSYAAPMVAGAAALVRQAAPRLDANAVRALLLNTTEFRSSDRNFYGLGSLRADAAVTAALAGDVVPGTVRGNLPRALFTFRFPASGEQRITISWMRSEFRSNKTPNLNLRILDDQNLVIGQDYNSSNSYESVVFPAVANLTYTAEVYWANPTASSDSVAFAIAGTQQRVAPTLSAIKPGAVTAYRPVDVELQGSGLASATQIVFGTKVVTEFTVLDDTRVQVTPPELMSIGTTSVRVENPHGVSPARDLTVTGPGNPVFVGPEVVTRSPTSTQQFKVYSGKHWRSLVLVSNSNQPSTIPNIYQLGIGNNWQAILMTVTLLSHDQRGASAFALPFPTSLPKVTVYLQALSVNPAAVSMPFPVSNVHRLTIQ